MAGSVGAPVPLGWPLTAEELEDLRWYVEDYLRAPFGVYEQRGAQVADRLPEWGRRLFSAVFGSGPARDAYVTVRTRVAASATPDAGGGPEIVFRSARPAWSGLPWELSQEPDGPSPMALAELGVARSLPARRVAQVLAAAQRSPPPSSWPPSTSGCSPATRSVTRSAPGGPD